MRLSGRGYGFMDRLWCMRCRSFGILCNGMGVCRCSLARRRVRYLRSVIGNSFCMRRFNPLGRVRRRLVVRLHLFKIQNDSQIFTEIAYHNAAIELDEHRQATTAFHGTDRLDERRRVDADLRQRNLGCAVECNGRRTVLLSHRIENRLVPVKDQTRHAVMLRNAHVEVRQRGNRVNDATITRAFFVGGDLRPHGFRLFDLRYNFSRQ